MAVSVSNVDLMERVCHLTNKIYREMLCITSHEGNTYITLRGLNGLDHDQVNRASQYMTLLSCDLLNWIREEGFIRAKDRFPYFFTKFITTPELSGPLYISPDIYHSQITEYLLESIYIR